MGLGAGPCTNCSTSGGNPFPPFAATRRAEHFGLHPSGRFGTRARVATSRASPSHRDDRGAWIIPRVLTRYGIACAYGWRSASERTSNFLWAGTRTLALKMAVGFAAIRAWSPW